MSNEQQSFLPCNRRSRQRSNSCAGGLSKRDLLSLAITPGCQLVNDMHDVAREVGDKWLQEVTDGDFVLSDSSVPVRTPFVSFTLPQMPHSSARAPQRGSAMKGMRVQWRAVAAEQRLRDLCFQRMVMSPSANAMHTPSSWHPERCASLHTTSFHHHDFHHICALARLPAKHERPEPSQP